MAMAILVAGWLIVTNLLIKSIFDSQIYHEIINSNITGRVITGAFYYITIVLVFYLLIYYQENRDQQLKAARLTGQLKDAELNVLKSQINPHFLFNSLNSISYLTLTDPEKAREIISKLSDFLRILLKENNQSTTTVLRELDLIRLYIDIEKSRFNEKLLFIENIAEECKHAIVPSLILLPLIENAIKHGVQNSSIPITVKINIKKIRESLELNVINTLEKGSAIKGTGLGLKNIQERLALLYKQQTCKIQKSADSFSVNLTIPFTIDGK
jgi:LytS/YehU family sensor histidine kinase